MLSANDMSAAVREAWIKTEAPRLDVLSRQDEFEKALAVEEAIQLAVF
jgi:hypothetical protein